MNEITGTVKTELGDPIQRAKVTNHQTGSVVHVGYNGEFTIDANDDDLLTFESNGYFIEEYVGVVDELDIVLTEAKKVSISGKIMDSETGAPLIGCNVIIDGTPHGKISGVDGYFSISAHEQDTILFDLHGYKNQRIEAIEDDSTYLIQLSEIPDCDKKKEKLQKYKRSHKTLKKIRKHFRKAFMLLDDENY